VRLLTFIIAIPLALTLAGCPGKTKTDEETASDAPKADGESGEKPPDKTMEQLKSLGYVQ
jgi:hypothetical protein